MFLRRRTENRSQTTCVYGEKQNDNPGGKNKYVTRKEKEKKTREKVIKQRNIDPIARQPAATAAVAIRTDAHAYRTRRPRRPTSRGYDAVAAIPTSSPARRVLLRPVRAGTTHIRRTASSSSFYFGSLRRPRNATARGAHTYFLFTFFYVHINCNNSRDLWHCFGSSAAATKKKKKQTLAIFRTRPPHLLQMKFNTQIIRRLRSLYIYKSVVVDFFFHFYTEQLLK